MLRSRQEDAGRVEAALSGFTAGTAASGARYQSPVATTAVGSAGASAAAIGEAVMWDRNNLQSTAVYCICNFFLEGSASVLRQHGHDVQSESE